MKMYCDWNLCKHNTNNGKEYKDIKHIGICTCQEDITFTGFMVSNVDKSDFDGDLETGAYDEKTDTAEGLFCSKYEFKGDKND